MKMVAVCVVLLFGLVSVCLAQQGHKPYEGQLETIPDQYQARPKPNVDEWSYQKPAGQVEKKPYTDEWSYQEPAGQAEKKPYEESGDLQQPDQPQQESASYPNETPDYGGYRPWGKGPPPFVPPPPRRR